MSLLDLLMGAGGMGASGPSIWGVNETPWWQRNYPRGTTPPFDDRLTTDPIDVTGRRMNLQAWSLMPFQGFLPGQGGLLEHSLVKPTIRGAGLAEGWPVADMGGSEWPPVPYLGAGSVENSIPPYIAESGQGADMQAGVEDGLIHDPYTGPPIFPSASPDEAMNYPGAAEAGYGEQPAGAPPAQIASGPVPVEDKSFPAGAYSTAQTGEGFNPNPWQLALLGAGSELLKGSGWSRYPVSTGQALGSAGQAGIGTYMGAKKQQDASALAKEQLATMRESRRTNAEIAKANQEMAAKVKQAALDEAKYKTDLRVRLNAAIKSGDQAAIRGVMIESNPEVYAKELFSNPDNKFVTVPMGVDAEGKPLEQMQLINSKDGTIIAKFGQTTPTKAGVEVKNEVRLPSEDFNKPSLTEQAKALIEQYKTVKTIPEQLAALKTAREAAVNASGFIGSGAEAKLALVKFLNNNLGLNVSPEQVANAEIARSALYDQIVKNLRQLDAQPSAIQERNMREALGNISNDPKALPRIIDIISERLVQRAKEHNRQVRQAKENKAQFMYDISVPGFDEKVDPWEQNK